MTVRNPLYHACGMEWNNTKTTSMENHNLLQVPIGTTVSIQNFDGGKGLGKKLRQYGLFIGDQVRIIRMAPFAGPILLEVNGREIALGRGVASKVIVEVP